MMNKMKRVLALALAAVMALGLLAGCGKDGQTSDSASGSASGSTGEAAPPAPGAENSDGIGRQYAELNTLYMKQLGVMGPTVPSAVVKSGNDQDIGPHLKQVYTLSPVLNLVVYTDPEDQRLLRITVEASATQNELDVQINQQTMNFVPYFFDNAETDAIGQALHLSDIAEGSSFEAAAASGMYSLTRDPRAPR